MATIARTQVAPRTIAQRLSAPRVAGYLLVLPAALFVLALVGLPLVLGVWYSLTDVTVAQSGKFVGLANFIDAASDPTFRLAVRNTLIIGVVATVAKITLSVALAFLMLGAFPGRSVLRTLFVLPWTIPIALSTIAWKWMFLAQYSVVNWVLIHVGLMQQLIQWVMWMRRSIGLPRESSGSIRSTTWRNPAAALPTEQSRCTELGQWAYLMPRPPSRCTMHR